MTNLTSTARRGALVQHSGHLLAQQLERPPQVALHRGDGHAQRCGNLFRQHVFLIPQHDHGARRFRKRGHQLPDLAAQ